MAPDFFIWFQNVLAVLVARRKCQISEVLSPAPPDASLASLVFPIALKQPCARSHFAVSSAIPLCAKHHRTGADSYHRCGPRKFAEVHQINVREIVARLSAKPIIRVESGVFVGRFGEEEFALGPTEIGLIRAVRRMSQLRREREADVA